ncbi:MAG: hypothetical protein U0572_01200 [Phycisphaerales bacterium]
MNGSAISSSSDDAEVASVAPQPNQPGTSTARQFWQELVALRVHAEYMHEYQLALQSRDRLLSCVIAIASSASIGAWAIWQVVPVVWAGIVALSQVVQAVRHLFPWEAQIEAAGCLSKSLTDLAIDAEERWFDVANGELTEQEIHASRIKLKRRTSKQVSQHLGGIPLKTRPDLLARAEDSARIYLRSKFGDD